MKVLITDDTKSYRMLLKVFLQQMNHEVIEAEDGASAIDAFKEHSEDLDLIFMDVQMPKLTGIDTVKRIRHIQQQQNLEWIPVIFLSASASGDDVEAGIQAGGDDYLVKPISKQILRAKMLAMQRIADMRSRLVEANQELHLQATTDPLTGAANRRSFDESLEKHIALSLRHKHSLGYAIFDLDHFKSINDEYGHDIGDYVLIEVCARIESGLREGDQFGRLGGEEFGLCLPHADNNNIENACERYRRLIADTPITLKDGRELEVTSSFGATLLDPEDDKHKERLYKRADEALYDAKHDGRNRVKTKLPDSD